MDDHLMNDPREIITETYEDINMEEVMGQVTFDELYEEEMDKMYAECEDAYDPDDDDEYTGEDEE